MKNIFYFNTPIGKIGISEENGYIVEVFSAEKGTISCGAVESNNSTIMKCYEELMEYFDGNRKTFSVPVRPEGTEFQKRVWKELIRIPYGETRSYKDIAIAIGNEKACRAVGGANNKNPILILIPCHRVIGKKGDLTGFGAGINMKEFLLNLENENASHF